MQVNWMLVQKQRPRPSSGFLRVGLCEEPLWKERKEERKKETLANYAFRVFSRRNVLYCTVNYSKEMSFCAFYNLMHVFNVCLWCLTSKSKNVLNDVARYRPSYALYEVTNNITSYWMAHSNNSTGVSGVSLRELGEKWITWDEGDA